MPKLFKNRKPTKKAWREGRLASLEQLEQSACPYPYCKNPQIMNLRACWISGWIVTERKGRNGDIFL